jgi:hypothetical protein
LRVADNGTNGLIYGFIPQFQYNVVLTNEQGGTNQALWLGDTSGTTTNDLFGISVANGAANDSTGLETWTPKLSLKGTGELVLSDTATLTGTASQRLQVTGGAYVSGNLGIGITNPTSKLDVVGGGNFTGVVTATSFSGSGTNLTGIVTSIVAGTNITVSGSTGQVTINSTATGGGGAALDILEVMLFAL